MLLLAAWIGTQGCGRVGYERALAEDGGVGAQDAVAATTCMDVCPGSCAGETCQIDCAAGECVNEVVCPPGLPCIVHCVGDNSCVNGVSCGDATSCVVTCESLNSCAAGVGCGNVVGSCDVTCSAMSACGTGVQCEGASVCNVECTGDSAAARLSAERVPVTCSAATETLAMVASDALVRARATPVAPGKIARTARSALLARHVLAVVLLVRARPQAAMSARDATCLVHICCTSASSRWCICPVVMRGLQAPCPGNTRSKP